MSLALSAYDEVDSFADLVATILALALSRWCWCCLGLLNLLWWSSCCAVSTVPVSVLCKDLLNRPSCASSAGSLVELSVASAAFDRSHLLGEVLVALATRSISTRSGIAFNISC